MKIEDTYDYDGILIKGSNDNTYISANHTLLLYSTSTKETNSVVFTPEYDGEMTVTYTSTGTYEHTRMCAIGTDVVSNTNSSSVIAYGVSDDPNVWKTLQAKMKAGVTYYIFNVNGGIKIDKIKYQESAASAVVDGDNVTLTTIADMQGWRPFYDAYNSYTVDNNTDVYVVVGKEDEEDAVKLINRTGKNVPMACPVILHTDNVQEDGTYLLINGDKVPGILLQERLLMPIVLAIVQERVMVLHSILGKLTLQVRVLCIWIYRIVITPRLHLK